MTSYKIFTIKYTKNESSTYNLQNGNVFLPPQVLLYFGTHSREQVIGVHDDVYKRVNEAE